MAEYLKRALVTTGRRPYTVAIASYALALLGKSQDYNPTESLLRAAAPGRLPPIVSPVSLYSAENLTSKDIKLLINPFYC